MLVVVSIIIDHIACVTATKTGLLLSKTARDEAQLLGKVNGSALLSVVVQALKQSPHIKLSFLQLGAIVKNMLEDKDSKDRLQQLMCLQQCEVLFISDQVAPKSEISSGTRRKISCRHTV